MNNLMRWYTAVTDISFWISFVEGFKNLGPLAPILLAFLESIIPALPLIVIVSFNVTAHGIIFGFIYSWLGSFLGSACMFLLYRKGFQRLFQNWSKDKKHLTKIAEYVDKHSLSVLFILASLPFTPSFLINLVYGLSNVNENFFIRTIFFAKAIMIGYLSVFGHSLTQITENPLYLIASIIGLIILYLLSKYFSKIYLER